MKIILTRIIIPLVSGVVLAALIRGVVEAFSVGVALAAEQAPAPSDAYSGLAMSLLAAVLTSVPTLIGAFAVARHQITGLQAQIEEIRAELRARDLAERAASEIRAREERARSEEQREAINEMRLELARMAGDIRVLAERRGAHLDEGSAPRRGGAA